MRLKLALKSLFGGTEVLQIVICVNWKKQEGHLYEMIFFQSPKQ